MYIGELVLKKKLPHISKSNSKFIDCWMLTKKHGKNSFVKQLLYGLEKSVFLPLIDYCHHSFYNLQQINIEIVSTYLEE